MTRPRQWNKSRVDGGQMKETTPDTADAVTQMPKVAPRRRMARRGEREFQRPVGRKHGTELSQYSSAFPFDKSCRNLSCGRFQRHCRQPLCRSGRAAFSERAARCRRETRLAATRFNAHSNSPLCSPVYVYTYTCAYTRCKRSAHFSPPRTRGPPSRALSPSLSLSFSLSLCGSARGSNESALRISGQPAGALVPLACCGSGGNGPVPDRK